MSDFYAAGPLGEVAINLFNGYGYNFYRAENQLRADDGRVRALACSLLGQARAAVDAAESAYRRERIPPPTRAQPFPDAAAVAGAQVLERLAGAIGAAEGRIRSAPAPANDRMTQLYRREKETLTALIERDRKLVEQAEELRRLAVGRTGDALLAEAPAIEERIAGVTDALQARQLFLV